MTMKKTKAVAKQPEKSAKEKAEHTTKVTLMPSVNAAAVIADYAKAFGEQDICELIDQLRTKFDQVENGDLKHCESMLVGQAHALQAIFVNLARRSAKQEYLNQCETYLRLALKAQNQCRATIETLAAIKNPPVVFAKQANINQGGGNQQVNNGTPLPNSGTCTRTHAHAGEIINQQNELLEVQHGGETVDTRTAGATIGKNPAMATVD